jgi:molecular chaperone HtpG
MLQHGRHVAQMRKWITKKVLDALQNMQENENDKYLMFWQQFGRAIKEAVGSDHANKDKILSLLLFASSAHPEKLTTLKDYVARMTEGQEQIFYLTGESRRVVENSPHLEVFRQEGYEVLYLTDPVDELVVQTLREFEGKKLKSVVKGTIELGDEETKKQVEQALKQKEAEASELLEFFQKTLDEHVKVVRLTNRLTTSPACLVGADHDYSPQLERLLLKGKGAGSKQRRIMELNPKHEMFDKMQEHFKSDHDDPLLRNYAELLLGYALLAEGSELPDPVQFNHLVIDMMTRAL